jgi:hypothetical protein
MLMCVIQQVKRKLYVEFRVTFTKKLYSSFGIRVSVDQERSTMTKKKKKKKEMSKNILWVLMFVLKKVAC